MYNIDDKVCKKTERIFGFLFSLKACRFCGQSYISADETSLYYLQSRYYNPEWGRFLNADSFTTTGQGLLGNNMFAYCGNNPVARKDNGGESWFTALVGAAIGGAVAGAIIGAVSHIVSCGINGSKVTVSGVLGAAVSGATTGAIGAIGGVVEGAQVVASVGVGFISGVTTAINTDGSTGEKIVAGLSAGLVAGGGAYLGTKIPIADDTAFTAGVTSFAGGLLAGTNAEIANVGAQQIVSSFFNDKSSGSRAIGGRTFSSGLSLRFANKAILQY